MLDLIKHLKLLRIKIIKLVFLLMSQNKFRGEIKGPNNNSAFHNMPFDYSSEIQKYVNVLQRGFCYKIANVKKSILMFYFIL